MKIELTKEKLAYAIQKLQKNLTKQISLPILESIYFSSKDNFLTLRTTNLHVGTEVTIPVKTEREGSVAVKFDLLMQIISHLKSKEEVITIEQKDNLLFFITPYSEMKLTTYNADEFPTLPRIETEMEFTLPVEIVVNGIKSVMYAASQSEIKPEISSVYIHREGNELIFVATDSFRLAEKRVVVEGVHDFPGVIIPIKNIQEFLRVFQNESGFITMKLSENQISFENDKIYFVSRIIDGTYPNYQQIIPQEEKTSVVFLKDDLVSSVKLVNVFSDEYKQIFLKTEKNNNRVVLSSKNVDIGESEVFIDAHIQGDDLALRFNYKYLSDVLGNLEGQSIAFSFTEERRPFIVRIVEDASFTYLIMPMNR